MDDPWGISGPDFVVLYIALLGAVLLIRLVVSGVMAGRAMRADHAQPGPTPSVYQLAFLAAWPGPGDRRGDRGAGRTRPAAGQQLPADQPGRRAAGGAAGAGGRRRRAAEDDRDDPGEGPRLRGHAGAGGRPRPAGAADVGRGAAPGPDVRPGPAAGRARARRDPAAQRHLAGPAGRCPGVPGADRGRADDRGRGPAEQGRHAAAVGRGTPPARPGARGGVRAGRRPERSRAACCSAAPSPRSPSAAWRCTRTKSSARP